MKYRTEIRRIALASYVMDGVYDRWAKQQGVKENTLWLLYALDDGQPHSQKQLCEQWLFPKTTLNTIVKECEAAGYLKLVTMLGNKREKQLSLTEKGRQYARKTLAPVYLAEEKAIEATLREYSPLFIEALEYLSKRLKDLLEKELSEKKGKD